MMKSEFRDMEPEEVKRLQDTGKGILVDVRREGEYAGLHIPGALNIPNDSIAAGKPAELPDPNAEIMLYCRTGRRAEEAKQKLAEMGYTHVRNAGGIIDWPYETETEEDTY